MEHTTPFGNSFDQLANFESRDGLRTPVLLLEAEYNRARACWNACKGISTETLELVPRFTEAGVKTVQSVEAEVAALKAQMDELLAALAFYANPGDYKAPFTGGMGKLYYDCGKTASEAIAKFQNGATGRTAEPMRPTYYVQHPDGTYSVASPQPTPEELAQQDGTYAQCDQSHGGSCCGDPDCHLIAKHKEASHG